MDLKLSVCVRVCAEGVWGVGFSGSGCGLGFPGIGREWLLAGLAQDDNLYMPARFFNESLIYCDLGVRSTG